MVYLTRKKIAIIGTGISGLGAAMLLHPYHDITIYEKNSYIGGHSRTVEVMTKNGPISVDTGFIVFNKINYPLLTRLFEYLSVPVLKSNMSFSVSIDNGWLEYGTQNLYNIFTQKMNFFSPSFWKMLFDILKFNAYAKQYLGKDPSFTLENCLDNLKVGLWFRYYFLLAMGGAIWSVPLSEMLNFPACTFIRFFDNHGLLSVNDHLQWYTIKNGSNEYIKLIIDKFKERIRINHGVKQVWRDKDYVVIKDIHGNQENYHEVVFACHADHALAMIENPSGEEKEILSAFRYQSNRVVLHDDLSFMPKRKKCWASWVYLSENKNHSNPKVSVSYWMNNLQHLDTDQLLIVTLNPGHEPKNVYNDYIFEHPVFDAIAIKNQSKIENIQGRDRFWFCGAYQGYGFHEDGLCSAVKMAKHMGIESPW
ncbi:NAD(P)/FAD-dependent oxidoreductase [Liberibacter crescens]|uniref:NAD(P)/FAD-dependent oxidoreductase n=1 Tax=Liberibacter crescens TaxID=1273132 RepID=UPI0005A05037|nr:NAD(P)-binding protein [Liberibacter crescens]AMC12443.1 amine oxidase [Liberibacter crescens]